MLKKKLSNGAKPFGKRLSTGTNNRRFKGTVKSNFYLKSCSEQSGN